MESMPDTERYAAQMRDECGYETRSCKKCGFVQIKMGYGWVCHWCKKLAGVKGGKGRQGKAART